MSESGRFLSRWSRRKQAARDAVKSAATAAPPAAEDPLLSKAALPSGAGESSASDATAADAPGLTEQELAELPRLDELTAESDVISFLRAGVPEPLRNAALRRVWALDPKIRDYVSEAREYAYDWNLPGGLPGNGPLPPDFDVRALVGRLFKDRGAAVPPLDAPASEQAAVPSRPRPASTEGDAVAAHPPRTRSTDQLPPEEPPRAASTIAAALDSDPGPDAAGTAAAGTASQPSRKRRHGGAIPL